jgi:hypothetical protein
VADKIEPWLLDPLSWLTVAEFARRIERPRPTVLRWCKDGTFTAFGITTWQSSHGRRLWWIKLNA